MAVGKTGRRVGAGAGDQWVKPGDWELGDHVTELFVVSIPIVHDAPIPILVSVSVLFWQYRFISVTLQMPDTNRYFL